MKKAADLSTSGLPGFNKFELKSLPASPVQALLQGDGVLALSYVNLWCLIPYLRVVPVRTVPAGCNRVPVKLATIRTAEARCLPSKRKARWSRSVKG